LSEAPRRRETSLQDAPPSGRTPRATVLPDSGDGVLAPQGPSVPGERAARLEFLERENAQLRQALLSRIVIEQAKGILAERYGIELEQAFELLRRVARSNRVRVHTLATAVVSANATPADLAAAVEGLRARAGTRRLPALPREMS
jgi:hypothetical protein